ncbi:hypothetical protein [Thioclava sp. GXIMD4216]|uniref:hypothetical protein n=1 Tax=unclassified Thioclava TaxID=2621713 RepID=UPI0030D260B0
MDWLKSHVISWTTSAALTLTLLQAITPSILDWILRAMIVGLVWLAARLSRLP